MATDKEGYERIPDIEQALSGAAENAGKENYPDLSEEEASLLIAFDKVIVKPSLDPTLPETSLDDVAAQGEGFAVAVIAPTIAAVCMLLVALLVERAGHEGIWPYIIAIVIYLASVRPIKIRFVEALIPVFEQVNTAEEKVKTSISAAGTATDSTIESLQSKLKEVVLGPMGGTLKTAKQREISMRKLIPGIDVPEPGFDKEMEEMKGIVTAKIDEAQQHLHLSQFIPVYLRSSEDLHRLVFQPVVVVALLIQLIAAWLTIHTKMATERILLIVVAISYGIALAEIGLVYFFTNATFRVCIVNHVIRVMLDGAMGPLQELGVTTTVEDVLGRRMVEVRQKTLTILRLYSQLDEGVGRLPIKDHTKAAEAPVSEVSYSDNSSTPSPSKKGFMSRMLASISPMKQKK